MILLNCLLFNKYFIIFLPLSLFVYYKKIFFIMKLLNLYIFLDNKQKSLKACYLRYFNLDNRIIYYYIKNDNIISQSNIYEENIKCDLILRSIYYLDNNNNYKNYTFIHNPKTILNSILKNKRIDLYENKPMLTSLMLSNEEKSEYLVDLNKPFNYYLVNNQLNHIFFRFYLKYTYNKSLTTIYTFKMMDHNLSMVYLNENEILTFGQNNYSIIK